MMMGAALRASQLWATTAGRVAMGALTSMIPAIPRAMRKATATPFGRRATGR